MKTLEPTTSFQRPQPITDERSVVGDSRSAARPVRAFLPRAAPDRVRMPSARHNFGSNDTFDRSRSSTLADLCASLKNVDHIKLKNHLTTMACRMSAAVTKYCEANPNILEIDRIYVQFLRRLWTHMFREENLYSSICNLERNKVIRLGADSLLMRTVRSMRRDHRYFARALRRIAALLRDYELPSNAGTTYRELVHGFRELEAFKRRHMENEVALYSRALTLEKQLMGKYPERHTQAC